MSDCAISTHPARVRPLIEATQALAVIVNRGHCGRLNAAEMLIDVAQPAGGASTRWIADSGVLDLFLLLGPQPADVMAQYARLTGPTAMPQVRAFISRT